MAESSVCVWREIQVRCAVVELLERYPDCLLVWSLLPVFFLSLWLLLRRPVPPRATALNGRPFLRRSVVGMEEGED